MSVCWAYKVKGVVFLSELTDDELEKEKYVIDINSQKIKGFLPISTKKVDSPDVLQNEGQEINVLIMNCNNEIEIKNKLKEVHVNAHSYAI